MRFRYARNAVVIADGGFVSKPSAITIGRLELGHYLREQAVSQTVHRYGNVLARYR